jgi:hypothetical protein
MCVSFILYDLCSRHVSLLLSIRWVTLEMRAHALCKCGVSRIYRHCHANWSIFCKFSLWPYQHQCHIWTRTSFVSSSPTSVVPTCAEWEVSFMGYVTWIYFYFSGCGVGWHSVHLVRRPLVDLLYHRRIWSSRWNDNWQRKSKYSEKTYPSATSSTTNLTWPDLGSNLGRRGGKPVTNCLSYGTAFNRLQVTGASLKCAENHPDLFKFKNWSLYL